MDANFISEIPLAVWEQVSTLETCLVDEQQNPQIAQLLNRTTLVGGKRFRPLLAFLMAQFFDLPPEQMIPYARAIEMVHAASLTHDDVIDQATTRRGHPSINMAASNKMAVLAGDYLLSDVIVEMCKLGQIRLVSELASVIKDLSDGEWLQMDSMKKENLHWNYLLKVATKKTASVMSWCSVVPAIRVGADEKTIETARSFGIELGIAFQLIDDTLDFMETETGKDRAIDLKNGIVNAVLMKEIEKDPELQQQVLADAAISATLLSGRDLSASVREVRQQAQAHLDRAQKCLETIYADHFHKTLDLLNPPLTVRPLLFVLRYLAERKF